MGWGRSFVFLLALASASPLAAQSGGIVVEWRVARPFPFFQDDFVYQYHLDTWQHLGDDRSIGNLERALNGPANLRAWVQRVPQLRERVPSRWSGNTENVARYVARQGWASVTVGRTIWNEGAQ